MALNRLKEPNNIITGKLENAQGFLMLMKLRKQLHEYPDELLREGRYLIKEGILKKMNPHGKSQQRTFFLFNDLLMWCQHSTDQSGDNFKYKGDIPLVSCKVELSPDYGSIFIRTPKKHKQYVFSAFSQEETEVWFTEISKATEVSFLRSLPGSEFANKEPSSPRRKSSWHHWSKLKDKLRPILSQPKDNQVESEFDMEYLQYSLLSYELLEILQDPVASKVFEAYLEKEYSQENIQFWQEVNEYRKILDNNTRVQKARHLYDVYVRDGSKRQINIPFGLQDGVTKEIAALEGSSEDWPADMFDRAQEHIFVIMELDNFRRFKNIDSNFDDYNMRKRSSTR
eukprot:GFYU01008740.1.p1 GENE.GFYU01008740.1~~GFYU01008740.1.p1  ORF type:complete len:369 (+),score=101.81 GFYU01008740.1:86-1108(+)